MVVNVVVVYMVVYDMVLAVFVHTFHAHLLPACYTQVGRSCACTKNNGWVFEYVFDAAYRCTGSVVSLY